MLELKRITAAITLVILSAIAVPLSADETLDRKASSWHAVPGTSPVWLNPGERLLTPPRSTYQQPAHQQPVIVNQSQPYVQQTPNYYPQFRQPWQGIVNSVYRQPDYYPPTYYPPNDYPNARQPWQRFVDSGRYAPTPPCLNCRKPFGELGRDVLSEKKTGDQPTLFD
jgi:hypothetical protein